VPVRNHILHQLADGRFHSGQQLAGSLGVSRSAVWKQIQRLESDFGLSVSAVRGRGYRLAAPLELLDDERIRQQLGDTAHESLDSLALLASTPSTNGCALGDPPLVSGRARVWLAEHQSDGRGRRGRRWVSTFGENLYLSMAWRFDLPMTELAGLSLVAGLIVAEALEQLGMQGHSLKWPNDVLVGERKLSGVLLEVSGESGGPATAVIGIGVNFRLADAQGAQIDQPWTDIGRECAVPLSRNLLAGVLIDRLITACRLFAAEKLAPFLNRWAAFDELLGRGVCVIRGGDSIEGVYRGIAPSGAMLLEDGTGLNEYHAGEISLRKEPDK
jgi:BirA family biotin operon repressor/biotin-[acetyl-CoA-carboxylase] ligase